MTLLIISKNLRLEHDKRELERLGMLEPFEEFAFRLIREELEVVQGNRITYEKNYINVYEPII